MGNQPTKIIGIKNLKVFIIVASIIAGSIFLGAFFLITAMYGGK